MQGHEQEGDCGGGLWLWLGILLPPFPTPSPLLMAPLSFHFVGEGRAEGKGLSWAFPALPLFFTL